MPPHFMNDKRKLTRDHGRVKLTIHQINVLGEFYSYNPRPGNKDRIFLAQKLGIGLDKVKNWFQNRRAKEKKDILEEAEPETSGFTFFKKCYPHLFPNCSDLFKRRDG